MEYLFMKYFIIFLLYARVIMKGRGDKKKLTRHCEL